MKKALVKSMLAPLYLTNECKGELDDEALYGMVVDILEEYGDALKIRTPYRYESYIEKAHLCFDEGEIARYTDPAAPLKTVYRSTVDVLDGEDYQNTFIMMLTRGACVEVEKEGKPWTKLRLIGGQEGYVRTSHLGYFHRTQHGDEEHFRKNVVYWAKKYLGAQYRWGGRTPLGIDCSGLCSEAYYINGVSIYRNASIMDGFPMHEIERSQMKEGDLLFFKGHVAMYIGNDEYIHSTGRAGDVGVVVNSLDPGSPIYREDLAKGIVQIGSIF